MADSKITALTALTAADPANDMIPIVDVSDTPPASGNTKRISINNLLACSPSATLASATISGDLTVRTNKLSVTSNGVGIGTATPAAGFALDIQTAAGTSARVKGGSGSGQGSAYYVTLAASSSTLLAIGDRANIFGGTPDTTASIYTGSGIPLTFDVGASTAMTLNSTGLGVGVASPAFKIHANGVIGTTNTFGAFTALQTAGGTGYRWTLSNDNNFYLQYSPDGFGSTATSRIALDSSGNVGVGVTPNTWTIYKALQVQGASIFSTTGNDTGFGSNVYYDGGYKFRSASSDKATRYEQFGGSHSWHYTVSAGTAGNTAAFTQAMTLDASGSLHVGTTAYIGVASKFVNSLNGFTIVPDNTANAANRNWNIAANGGAAGNLDFAISSANNTFPNFAYRMQITSAGALNNTTGTYGTISDLRLKENISDARNYLADLLKLRVVKYSLKEESSAVATKLGFIAQEVELVFPNLVDQSDKEYDGAEGIRSVKTSILIPMLLKAIQELTARVQTLEAR